MAKQAVRREIPAYRLGIDLGGTKIHAVVINRRGRPLGSARRPTKPEGGYREVLKRLCETASEAVADARISLRDIRAVGLGMPGPVDLARGRVVVAPNLGWSDKPVAADLQALLRQPVMLMNDVNCGGLGEATYGAAKGAGSAAAAFVGTGLGGAIILAGKVINGAHGFGGEIGHVPAPFDGATCACGRIGCLETVASKTGIARLIIANRDSGMRCKIKLDKRTKLRSSDLMRAWQADCPSTRKAVKLSARGLAWGLATIGGVFDPEVFVIGGGVIEAMGKVMLPLVREHLRDYSLLYSRRRSDVRLAGLGDDAVAIGAAVASQDARR
jgi:glucokinase